MYALRITDQPFPPKIKFKTLALALAVSGTLFAKKAQADG
jgi:hypothetical protein